MFGQKIRRKGTHSTLQKYSKNVEIQGFCWLWEKVEGFFMFFEVFGVGWGIVSLVGANRGYVSAFCGLDCGVIHNWGDGAGPKFCVVEAKDVGCGGKCSTFRLRFGCAVAAAQCTFGGSSEGVVCVQSFAVSHCGVLVGSDEGSSGSEGCERAIARQQAFCD